MENNIPEKIQLVMKWSSFVCYDFEATRNLELFDMYSGMRLWLQAEMFNNNWDKNPFVVNEKNCMRIWFECERTLNKSSMQYMKHINYKLEKRYNGLTMIDLSDKK